MSPPIAGSSHATSSGNLAMQSGMSSENPQENEVSYKAPDDETDSIAHPKKRAKKSTNKNAGGSTRTMSSGGRKLAGRLSVLLDISLDILYEVLGHLLPGDLISMSRVSKSFRKLLLSRSASFIWKTSFNNIAGLPACPEDVALPVWANLVWGGVYCHSCGTKRVMKIDFLLRRRICLECLKQNACFYPQGILTLASDMPPALYECIPYTLEVTKEYSRPIWWRQDIISFYTDFKDMEKTTREEDRPAATARFLRDKLSELRVREDVARAWSTWISQSAAEKADKREVKKGVRRAEVLKRCMELGYEEADCQRALRHRSVNTEAKLTEKGWGTILPQIRPLIETSKMIRLQREREERKSIRLKATYAAYFDIIRSLSASALELACLPSAKKFCTLPEVRALVDADTEAMEERMAQIKTMAQSLMPDLSAVASRRKNAIFALIQDGSDPVSQPAPSIPYAALGKFQLATSIFVCSGTPDTSSYHNKPLHGLHVFGHTCEFCKPSADDTTAEVLADAVLPRFSEKGRDVVVAILRRLGLNEHTTTPAELERLDKRFVCTDCRVQQGNDWGFLGGITSDVGRHPMSWWGLLTHNMQTRADMPDSHHSSSFYVLDIVEESAAKFREQNLTIYRITEAFERFGCYHCDIHYREAKYPSNLFSRFARHINSNEQAYLSRVAMVEHIRTVHAIDDPLMHRDFFPDPKEGYPCLYSA